MDDELKKKINDHYQKAEGSIQDIARVYRLSVDEVLRALGMDDMLTTQSVGDLIDQDEAGFDTVLNPHGQTHKVPYTTD